MKDRDFALLTESLQQAIQYRNGNRTAARTAVRSINVPEYRAEEVAALRKKLKLTQGGLASVMGVSCRTVEAWEAGINRPSGSARHLLYLLGKDEKVLALLKA